MPSWTDPCTGRFAASRGGRHARQRGPKAKQRNFCPECGARDEADIRPDVWTEYETAWDRFRKACDEYERCHFTGLRGIDVDEKFNAAVEWQRAFIAFKAVEEKVG